MKRPNMASVPNLRLHARMFLASFHDGDTSAGGHLTGKVKWQLRGPLRGLKSTILAATPHHLPETPFPSFFTLQVSAVTVPRHR